MTIRQLVILFVSHIYLSIHRNTLDIQTQSI